MGLSTTLYLLCGSAAVLGLTLWHDRRPWWPGKRTLVVPMLAAATATLILAIHLGALLLR